jgi:hypothetical protein
VTLTLTPEIILLLTVIVLIVQTIFYVNRRFDQQKKHTDVIELAILRASESSKARDEGLLAVAKANNAFLAGRAVRPVSDITRQLRQRQAMADAEEAVSVYGYPMHDIKEALQAEMDADGPE